MRLAELIAQCRADILAVAARHGATTVRIFGSVARDEDDENSDIDFLVELQEGRSLLDLGGLVVELRDLLGRPVDVVTVRGLKDRIRARVLGEATITVTTDGLAVYRAPPEADDPPAVSRHAWVYSCQSPRDRALRWEVKVREIEKYDESMFHPVLP